MALQLWEAETVTMNLYWQILPSATPPLPPGMTPKLASALLPEEPGRISGTSLPVLSILGRGTEKAIGLFISSCRGEHCLVRALCPYRHSLGRVRAARCLPGNWAQLLLLVHHSPQVCLWGSSPSIKPGSGTALRLFTEPLWRVLAAWLGLQAGGMQLSVAEVSLVPFTLSQFSASCSKETIWKCVSILV